MGSDELTELLKDNTKAMLLDMPEAEGAKKGWDNEKIGLHILKARARADADEEAKKSPDPAPVTAPAKTGSKDGFVIFECDNATRGVKVVIKGQITRYQFTPHTREDTGEVVGRLKITDKAHAAFLAKHGYLAPQPTVKAAGVDLSQLD